LVTFNTKDSQRRQLRSSTTRAAAVRRARTQGGSVHFLFAILMCGIVSLLQFVILTVIQLSDVHSSHIYSALLFAHNCYPIQGGPKTDTKFIFGITSVIQHRF